MTTSTRQPDDLLDAEAPVAASVLAVPHQARQDHSGTAGPEVLRAGPEDLGNAGECCPTCDPATATVVQRFRQTQQIPDGDVALALQAAQSGGTGGDDEAAGEADPQATRVQRLRTSGATELPGDEPASSDDRTLPDPRRPPTTGSRTDADPLVNLTSAPLLELSEIEDAILPPEREGRYEVLETMGKGGMGVVLKVRDHALRREVAMKVLQPELAQRPEYVAALRREAKIVGGLEHPAIISVHELGVRGDGTTYYTMKLMPSLSLGEVVHRLQLGDTAITAEFPLRRLVGIVLQIAQGLEFAHDRGVVHRDLKPENIQLGSTGEVQVMDWGIAKNLHSAPAQGAEGLVLGTPAYMSPEQAAGHDSEVDQRSDIYSLGVILYEMLTLKRPFAGENSQQQLEATKNVVPLLPSVVARDRHVPLDLEALCMRMLEKKKERRPQTMREVWQALDRYLAGELERERLRLRAEQCYQRGLEELATYDALKSEREFLLQEETALQRDVRPWHTQEDKQHVWSVRYQLQMLDVLCAHAFSSASELLRQAIDQGDGHRAARQKLIELYWQRHDEAASQDDNATKLFFARQAHALGGPDKLGHGGKKKTGTVHIRSQPPGALIYAIPFDEIRGSMGRPSPQYEVGCAPIAGLELPLGPYVLIARLDGHRDAMETLYVREQNRDLLLLCYPWSSELPLVGREVELQRLWMLMEDAELRSRPVTCLVAGPQGLGKNVLLDAFRRQIQRHPHKIFFLLEVFCDRLRRDLPYSAVVELVRLRAGILELDSADQARQKLRRMVVQAYSRFGRRSLPPERVRDAERVADTIAALPAFDIEDPSRMGVREEMQSEGRRRVTEALATYFQAVAVSTPVLVLVRNAQHMDPCSRRFFNDLLDFCRGSPILVVASSTESDEVEPLQASPLRHLVPHQPPFHFDEHLQLGPLPPLAVTSLVREMLAAPVSPKLMDWIQEHALGNPFMAGELVHLLARLGAMELQAAEWRLVRDRLPHTVRPGELKSVVRALIDTLPGWVCNALSTAVVVGGEFWAGALRDLGVQRLDEALEQLVQAGLIVRNASSRYAGDREYRLTSALRRRVAYDMLPNKQRRALHRRVATWIARKGRTDLEEGLRLAHHLKMGGQPQEAALLYARIAKAAMAVGAEEEAERLFTQAYVLAGDPDLHGQIEVQLRVMSARARSRLARG